MHAKIENNAVIQYPIVNLRQHLSNFSLPADLTNDAALPQGYVYVNTSAPPAFDPITQKVQEAQPVFAGGKWVKAWEIIELDSAKIAENQQKAKKELIASYTQALDDHLDRMAQTKRYENRVTCALRAGYPGPFQAEGQAFATWMDTCNDLAYQWWAAIEADEMAMFSSKEDFISQLPEFVWPQ